WQPAVRVPLYPTGPPKTTPLTEIAHRRRFVLLAEGRVYRVVALDQVGGDVEGGEGAHDLQGISRATEGDRLDQYGQPAHAPVDLPFHRGHPLLLHRGRDDYEGVLPAELAALGHQQLAERCNALGPEDGQGAQDLYQLAPAAVRRQDNVMLAPGQESDRAPLGDQLSRDRGGHGDGVFLGARVEPQLV